MQALLAELAKRGTFVTPEALVALEKAPQLHEGLLTRADLPIFLTPADLGSTTASAAAIVIPLPQPATEHRPAPASEPAPAPAPFTPDTRGALLEEPVVPEPPKFTRSDKPLAPRPRLMEAYAHDVLVEQDVTGNSTCEGAITDFTKYFNDRLGKIKKMLKQRREMVGFVPVARAKSGGIAEVKLIGIVTEVRTTKNGHRLIELEDESGSCAILAPASEHQVLTEADTVIEDEVIGVICKPPGRGDLLILQKIVRPDIPMQNGGRRPPNASAVAVLSDIHFGSKTFLHEDWERFVRWINLEWGDSRMKALARKVKYLIVNGDVVDGIGIFPGQEEELAIVDAYDQYAYAGEQLDRIRDDIKMYVLPGNHDLVRPAEPQPALPEKYKKLFPESALHVGNPVKLSFEGVEFLSYHGRSMDDWITRVSGMTYNNPIAVMKEMLQRRHVLPVYGLRTPIAPEHKDYLVIESVPDVFITGHVHAAGLEQHRGVSLINASCWQSQTAYQKMHGFMPDPSKVPVVELDTGKAWMVDFHRGPSGVDVVGRSTFGGAFRQPARIDDPGVIT
ncbi:MAG TPA: DNA-directed DNA polymerase II small subunit [Candidatus Thermoplasmatota archaeon]|nr:DNA-directed DNA polymerase II small subunit [Candidatus Thermoplasmatota archaeon]